MTLVQPLLDALWSIRRVCAKSGPSVLAQSIDEIAEEALGEWERARKAQLRERWRLVEDVRMVLRDAGLGPYEARGRGAAAVLDFVERHLLGPSDGGTT